MKAVYQIGGVSKQAVHKHNARQRSASVKLSELAIHAEELRRIHPGCGVEKMYDTLRPDWLGRDKFISTFMDLGFRLKKTRNYRRTTYPSAIYYPNLIEGMLVQDKNRVWQTDITYYEIQGTFYYLIFIVDIYTKVIRGYRVSDHMRAEANIQALKMAIRGQENVAGVIHHSDRGSQFTDATYRAILTDHGIPMSMGIVAWENAYAERVNGIIKNEYLKYKKIKSLKALRKEVKYAVNNYNKTRIHRSLPGKQSPEMFESQLLHLSTQNRPKVIVYAEGKPKISTASSRADFYPEAEPQVHVCPMVNSK